GYHRSRPPLTEQLSIAEALVLTDATRCPVNLLHLSSAEAVASGADGRRRHPHLDIRLRRPCTTWLSRTRRPAASSARSIPRAGRRPIARRSGRPSRTAASTPS